MKLYTKYDFIPGNKVIFYDDMKDEEEGEFPWRWNLDNGVWEVARLGKEYWILCTDDGTHARKGFVSDPLKELCEAAAKPATSQVRSPSIGCATTR